MGNLTEIFGPKTLQTRDGNYMICKVSQAFTYASNYRVIETRRKRKMKYDVKDSDS